MGPEALQLIASFHREPSAFSNIRKSCFIGAVSVVYAQTHFIDSRDTDNVHSSGVYPFWYTMFLHPDVRHGTSFCYVIPPVLSPLP